MPTTELEPARDRVVTSVDPAEVPSAAWGWSTEYPRVFHALGWVIVVFLLAMLIGNHQGNVENVFLIGFAASIAALILRDMWVRRNPR